MESPAEPDDFDSEFKNLCFNMGLALVRWQHVEDEHFYLFQALTGLTGQSICSIIYHSSESFEARRNMVTRLARHRVGCFDVKRKRLANRYINCLDKQLKDANLNRNKIAHYGFEYGIVGYAEQDNGDVSIDFSPPRLQPSPINKISQIQGFSSSDTKHNLSSFNIKQYLIEFGELACTVRKFNCWFFSPPPQREKREHKTSHTQDQPPPQGTPPQSETPSDQ
jgi:hypothetical protein